jgi:hypothetical protein
MRWVAARFHESVVQVKHRSPVQVNYLALCCTSMIVTVTGADGLLGSNLVRLLLEAGHQVRVLLEEGRRSRTLEGLDVERYYGTILDAAALGP